MILTSIGEQQVSVGDRHVRFRPSLLNMTRLGTPREIVEAFVAVCGAPQLTGNPVLDEPRVRQWRGEQFRTACSVLWCCTEDDDISWLIGYTNERFRYVRGALPLEDIVGLATGLLRHGVMGDVPATQAKPTRKDFVSEFKALDFATTAMAHLGTSEADAWQLTMTSYIGAMRAKFPPPPDEKKPLDEVDFDRVSGWLARVNKARASAGAANV